MVLQWETNREEVVQQGVKIIAVLSESLSPSEGVEGNKGLPGTGCIQRAYEMLEKKFDEELGGFGKAPKFPQPSMKQ